MNDCSLTMHQAEELLIRAGIRPSPIRVMVLRCMADAPGPLSSLEMESRLDTVDRSSITRTLTLFAGCNMIHTVDDGSGAAKYELCRAPGHTGHGHGTDDDLHPHFHCIGCGTTYCLDDTGIPEIPLPEGFVAATANYVIKGYCPRCRRP